MNRSDSINELAAALAKAQGAIEGASKAALNPHFNRRYADLASVWDACRGPLTSNGLTVVQTVAADDHSVTVTTLLLHTSGQWISGDTRVPLDKPDAQRLGSATTYGRRYSLMAMVGVAPEDDDGNAASDRAGASHGPGKLADAPQVKGAVEDGLSERQRVVKARKEMIAKHPEITPPKTSERRAPGKLGGKEYADGTWDGISVGEMAEGELAQWTDLLEKSIKDPAQLAERPGLPEDLKAIKDERAWRREVLAKSKEKPK